MSGYGKLRRCTERNATIVDSYLYLAAALVTIRRYPRDYSGPRTALARPHARSTKMTWSDETPDQNGCAARDSNPEPAD
jgi:hypothetical protein